MRSYPQAGCDPVLIAVTTGTGGTATVTVPKLASYPRLVVSVLAVHDADGYTLKRRFVVR